MTWSASILWQCNAFISRENKPQPRPTWHLAQFRRPYQVSSHKPLVHPFALPFQGMSYYPPSVATMSQSPPVISSNSNYRLIFDNALSAYKKETGKDLTSDPLLLRLRSCNSPDAVLALLREHIPGFDQPGSSGDRLSNWLNPTVNVLYSFSSTIGGAVGLVSIVGAIHPRLEL